MEAVQSEGSMFIEQLCSEQKVIDWVMNHSEHGDFYNSKLSCLDIINELVTVKEAREMLRNSNLLVNIQNNLVMDNDCSVIKSYFEIVYTLLEQGWRESLD